MELENERRKNKELLKKHAWLRKYWREYMEALHRHCDVVAEIEKQMEKEAKEKGFKSAWFATTIDGETFGIDLNNARENKKGSYLIHDTELDGLLGCS